MPPFLVPSGKSPCCPRPWQPLKCVEVQSFFQAPAQMPSILRAFTACSEVSFLFVSLCSPSPGRFSSCGKVMPCFSVCPTEPAWHGHHVAHWGIIDRSICGFPVFWAPSQPSSQQPQLRHPETPPHFPKLLTPRSGLCLLRLWLLSVSDKTLVYWPGVYRGPDIMVLLRIKTNGGHISGRTWSKFQSATCLVTPK